MPLKCYKILFYTVPVCTSIGNNNKYYFFAYNLYYVHRTSSQRHECRSGLPADHILTAGGRSWGRGGSPAERSRHNHNRPQYWRPGRRDQQRRHVEILHRRLSWSHGKCLTKQMIFLKVQENWFIFSENKYGYGSGVFCCNLLAEK